MTQPPASFNTISSYMQDNNVFFYLTAADDRNKASSAIKLSQNSRWFHQAKGGVEEKPTITSREPTPVPEGEQQPTLQVDATEKLVVTFSELQKVCHDGVIASQSIGFGVVFGTDPRSCHVVLGFRGTAGISAKQFTISTDRDHRPLLIDLGSTYGTSVETQSQNKDQKRIRHQWILAGRPGILDRFNNINIWLGSLGLKITFPNHRYGTPTYIQNLKEFSNRWGTKVQDSTDASLAFSSLGFESHTTTQAPTGAHTPIAAPVYHRDKQIGQGAFGQVHLVIRMDDGLYYAAKTFTHSSNKRSRNSSDPLWLANIKREFSILKDNPHPNVMKVLAFHEQPEPTILMEYYERGNIADVGALHEATYVTAFGQVLSGLEHLHSKGVAHRDLKPQNLLVQWNPFFKVAISDFGLAKNVPDSALLYTFCGTLTYTAPEIFPQTAGYDHLVDIWSLGVIVFEWLYGIPTVPRLPDGIPLNRIDIAFWPTWTEKWSRRLHDRLDDQEDSPMLTILYGMLEKRANRRWTASSCLQQGFEHNIFRRRKVDSLVACGDDSADVDDASNRSEATTPIAPSIPIRNEIEEPTIIVEAV